MSKQHNNLGAVRRAGKFLDCSRVLKNCFNVYVFFQLRVLCPRVDVVGRVSFWFTRYIIVRSAEMRDGELCCLEHRSKVSVLCLLFLRFIIEWISL